MAANRERPAVGMMPEESEGSRGFKVEDRRRFTSEGEGAESPQAHKADESEEPQFAPSAAPQGPPAGRDAAGVGAGSLPEITFSSFILGLSTQALMYLGEIASPQGDKPTVDLASARQMIDVLGVLEKKTSGNLEKDEEQLLDSMLFDLRMKYVQLAKKG